MSSGDKRQKPLPHSLEAEFAVLGSVFVDPSYAQEHSDLLNPKYFFLQRHQILVEMMIELVGEGIPPDLINVLERLRFKNKDDIFESPDQIQVFLNYATHPENVKFYLQEIKKYWELREVVKTCSDLVFKGRQVAGANVDSFLQEAEKVFIELSQSRTISGLVPSSTIIKETIEGLEELFQNPGGVTGVSSGFVDLDKVTAGFQASDLIILAARPAMGKTSLVLNFGIHAAIHMKRQVAIFSLEMSRVQLMQRFLAMASRIQAIRFRDGKLSAEELERLYPEALQFQTDKLMIDDTPSLSLFDLSSRCRKMMREKGNCDLIIIDYLQLMTVSANFNSKGNREREISLISMGLKALAKELQCPVIACAQLNRSVETRPDKRPRPSDLRESGSIEQDADLVCFIYRDEVYNKDTLDKGIAEIIIGKNRHGPTDTVKLAFQSEYTSFHNLAKI
jgi:replicative DNA helicase